MNDVTEIVFILDQSDSMAAIKSETIKGFNEFLSNQRRENETLPARMTLTLFDTKCSTPYHSVSVMEAPFLNEETYKPNDCTALLDAIGQTIISLGERLSQSPEEVRPGTVIVCILTDGEENSSTLYTWTQISEMIKHQTEVYKWQFLFLGANQDAIATASKINITGHNAACFDTDDIEHVVGEGLSTALMSRRAPREGTPSMSLQAMIPMRPQAKISK